jgi:hypothetical protein
MSTKQHQRIAAIIARKMRVNGYDIVGFDGNESIISSIAINATPKIKRHKPDVIGVNIIEKKICIGEAKTKTDLLSKRTIEQLNDFSDIIINEKDICELIIGITKESEPILKNILDENGLGNKKNVSYILIPEALLYENEDGQI